MHPFNNNTSKNNINSKIKENNKNYIEPSSTENDYDFLHFADDSTTITDTTIKPSLTNTIISEPEKIEKHYINEKKITISTKPKLNKKIVNIINDEASRTNNYRTLIKIKCDVDYISSDDEKLNAVIREQNRRTCLQRANSIQVKKPLRNNIEINSNNKLRKNLNENDYNFSDDLKTNNHELDAILYEMGKSKIISAYTCNIYLFIDFYSYYR